MSAPDQFFCERAWSPGPFGSNTATAAVAITVAASLCRGVLASAGIAPFDGMRLLGSFGQTRRQPPTPNASACQGAPWLQQESAVASDCSRLALSRRLNIIVARLASLIMKKSLKSGGGRDHALGWFGPHDEKLKRVAKTLQPIVLTLVSRKGEPMRLRDAQRRDQHPDLRVLQGPGADCPDDHQKSECAARSCQRQNLLPETMSLA